MLDNQEQVEGQIKYEISQHNQNIAGKLPTWGIVVIILLIANIGITLALTIDHFSSSEESNSNNFDIKASIPLPEELQSNQAKMDLYDSLVSLYNDRDIKSLYEKFDDLLKTEYSFEDFEITLNQLYEIIGPLHSGAYSHYEVDESSFGQKQFVLFYNAKTKDMGAEVDITLLQQYDEPFRIVGFHIVGDFDT